LLPAESKPCCASWSPDGPQWQDSPLTVEGLLREEPDLQRLAKALLAITKNESTQNVEAELRRKGLN
jgi:hypothetical protein